MELKKMQLHPVSRWASRIARPASKGKKRAESLESDDDEIEDLSMLFPEVDPDGPSPLKKSRQIAADDVDMAVTAATP